MFGPAVCYGQINPCYGMIMSSEETSRGELIKNEGKTLTLSVSGSTGTAIDHNYRKGGGDATLFKRRRWGGEGAEGKKRS